MGCRKSERANSESTSATTYPGYRWADVSAPGECSERVQVTTPSAQDRARHQSTDEAHKEEPACAPLVPARNS